MRGDQNKLRIYIKEFGIEFVLEAVENAIDLKNAEDMGSLGRHATATRRESEARILNLLKDLGVKLYG